MQPHDVGSLFRRIAVDVACDRRREQKNEKGGASERPKNRVASGGMKTCYDLRDNAVGFQARDLVWLYNHRRRNGCCPKLSSNWEGNCRDEDQRCRLQHSTRAEEENEDCSLRPSHGVQQ
ncbi:hypothetical protein Zmor_009793 [Zophobas morio]|uniref:Uncharacterized protein n=1 Tax=Zophobas morio TaxID=2755281 RepID=A0AA38MIY6_9CUCU|nr:hypothetical protein Zmor_009793 [Zophobas morio]